MNTLDDESYSIPSLQTTQLYTIHAFLTLLALVSQWINNFKGTELTLASDRLQHHFPNHGTFGM